MESRNDFQKQLVRLFYMFVVVSTLVILLTTWVTGNFYLKVSPFKKLSGLQSKESARKSSSTGVVSAESEENYWKAPEINEIKNIKIKEEVVYGRNLIAHTSAYLGPKGSVRPISNGLNCQNCHLDAGTKTFGNNYGSVASTYPKFRARSGQIESINKRVNDCMERSLNGKPLDTLSREMNAIRAYINFLGTNVRKGEKASGAGLMDLEYLDRAASPEKGEQVYETKCQNCHQHNGEGKLNSEGTEYSFPPLWGKNSYNDAAGLYRISNLAKYVRFNMPLGVSFRSPMLSVEEAWDVAAYINSMDRPHKDNSKDWPDISRKPADHPSGPYIDPFPEEQHKYGPFKPIVAFYKNKNTTK